MFCSQTCRNEFDENFKKFEMFRSSKPILASVFKALKISGGFPELQKIFFDNTPTTVYDYDWRNLESSQKQMNLLKCAASLAPRATCQNADSMMADMNMLSGLIKQMNLSKQST
jgi:hypothetical protein